MFDMLEDQMCEFSIDNVRSVDVGSPDRVDALVWGLTEIFDKITGRRRRSLSPGDAEYKGNTTFADTNTGRSEEHTSALQSLMRHSYAVFCLKHNTIIPHYCTYQLS